MKGGLSPGSRFWVFLSALAVFYFAIALIRAQDVSSGDEGGYLAIAEDLAKGQLPYVGLWGPGYPCVLAVFAKLGLPLIWAKLANVCFLLGTIIYLRASMRLYLPDEWSATIALVMGLYPPFLFYLQMTVSEKFAVFLVSAAAYHYLAMMRGNSNRAFHQIIASFALAWLLLTKVFFGYVTATCLALALVVAAARRRRPGRTAAVLAVSLLLCVPYLAHNWRLTGKPFYWAASGGMTLYWMSTPFPGETGEVFHSREVNANDDLRRNHGDLFHTLERANDVERDDAFRRAALQNITEKPLKYISNMVANVSRMLFDYPHDYKYQSLKALKVMLPNGILLGWFVASLIVVCRARLTAVSEELWCILVFAGVAFGGTSMVSAVNRYFTVIVPILCIWTACVWFGFVRLEVRTQPDWRANERY